MDKMTSLYLAQSYRDSWDDYSRSLVRGDFPHWDYIVLTASNEQQAECFRAQLEQREAAGYLPLGTHFSVIPDPEGKRVGSGGATLGVIRHIAQVTGKTDFAGLRILVIHSGGDSKRVPQYSALGKLFSPVPHELPGGRAATLFDEFLIGMSSVPSRIPEGMLLLSGDVLLLFNPLQIGDPGTDACALSFKESVDIGKNHGVFLRGSNGLVRKFLHKQTVASLNACGAVDARGNVDIDTGSVLFSAKMLQALYGLLCENGEYSDAAFDRYVNDKVRLSLYGDFLYPLAEDATLEDYYKEKPEGSFCDALTAARTEVWKVLRPFRMKLQQLSPAKFIHFGTTGEILKLMSGGIDKYSELGWHRNTAGSAPEHVACYNGVLASGATVGEDCYLEVSHVHGGAKVGDRTVLSYVEIVDECIPSDVVLHGLKQRDGKFVVRIYGVNDNPKADLETCPFLGGTLRDFMAANKISEEELWESDDRTLWTAKLYPACETPREAVAAALNVYAMAHGEGDVFSWRASTRKSLCSGFNDAAPEALIAFDRRMRETVQMERLLKLIRAGKPASRAGEILSPGKLTKAQEQWLEEQLRSADYSEAMRLHYYIGAALGGSAGEAHIGKCFHTIQETILGSAMDALRYNDSCAITADRYEVHLPLRVNWGGGWSDTPPYCNENGGTVLNAAISLDGKLPVEVILERIPEYKIVFDSADMDVHGEFDAIEPLQRTGDPYDPFALQKACLLSCGVIPRTGGSLQQILQRLGGGFVMYSQVRGVPKGSGLGTSSILSAACVKAVFGFLGIAHTEEELYDHVLCMEQIMSTGGGWQDQVGGLSNGIKYTSSLPGVQQKLRVNHIAVPPRAWQELNERFVLIYTGQRRLARNLLRDVVGRYVGGEPDSLFALNEIQRVAALMRFELERGHVDDFAKLLSYHWELSLKVDAGSTNTLIDRIFGSIDDLIDGKLVCGAGGGGFLQVIMKKGVTKEMLSTRLKEAFPNDAVAVWECSLI